MEFIVFVCVGLGDGLIMFIFSGGMGEYIYIWLGGVLGVILVIIEVG